jgi:hypothetical protein
MPFAIRGSGWPVASAIRKHKNAVERGHEARGLHARQNPEAQNEESHTKSARFKPQKSEIEIRKASGTSAIRKRKTLWSEVETRGLDTWPNPEAQNEESNTTRSARFKTRQSEIEIRSPRAPPQPESARSKTRKSEIESADPGHLRSLEALERRGKSSKPADSTPGTTRRGYRTHRIQRL